MSIRAYQVTKETSTFKDAIAALEITTLPRVETLSAFDVRIRVSACSLNFYDLLQMIGKYQLKLPVPFTPCSEGTGVVVEIGSKVKKFKVGDRAMFGMVVGSLAEEVVYRETQLLKVPECLSVLEASGFSVGYLTAYHGIVTRGEVKPGEWVLVTGAAGGMGLAAIQIAKAVGAKVIAAASSSKKLEACKEYGADAVVNYKSENLKDAVSAITGGKLVNVVYEVVGGKVFSECVRCMAGGGRLLVVGFASGEIPKVGVNMTLIKGFSIVGVRAGYELLASSKLFELLPFMKIIGLNPQETSAALIQLADKGLKPKISKVYKFEDAATALSVLADREAVGKIVVTVTPQAKA